MPSAVVRGSVLIAFLLSGATLLASTAPTVATASASHVSDADQAQAPEAPRPVKLPDAVGRAGVAVNGAWTLNTALLALFMQAGFALLTCGLVRRKNAAHLVMLNFSAYVFALIAYYVVGYAFQFGAIAVNAAPASGRGIERLSDVPPARRAARSA